jgi:hypothetical protein
VAAVAAGVGTAGEDARVLAAGVRHWLEAHGERRLLVFDNAVDLDVLRPFLPAAILACGGAGACDRHEQRAFDAAELNTDLARLEELLAELLLPRPVVAGNDELPVLELV